LLFVTYLDNSGNIFAPEPKTKVFFMPKLSLFNDIFREPWMIEPQTAAAQKQVLRGLLMGLEFTQEDETVQAAIGHKENRAIPRGRNIDVVNLEGTMLRDDGPCGMVGTRTLASLLREADAKADVLGHILYIDSGGGAANSVPDLAEAIQACQKPVVAFVDGYMCSAAMYAGSYCHSIIANREDNRVGCIGTMIQLEDWPKQARDNDGEMHIRVYADGAEEKNDEYEKALEGDFNLIKERVLNPANERFKADIRRNRPAAREDQLKGRTYEAREVIGTLVDSIGNFDAAVQKVIELSNLNITTMKGHENLQSLDTCRDLQMVDGYVSLNGEQLAEIDTAIGKSKTEKALNETNFATIAEQLTTINELTQERDDLKAKADQLPAKEQEIDELTTERDTLKEQIAQKDARIAELEAALDKNPDNDENPLPAMHNGNPAKEDTFRELSDEEALEYARKVVNGEI
jgi:protease-4